MLTELLQKQLMTRLFMFLIKMQSKTINRKYKHSKSNYLSMWADSEFWLDEQLSKQL